MLIQEKIRLYRLKGADLFKPLTALGIPKPDHKWIRLAISADGKAIVTEDIDLFDPKKKKNCSADLKKEIKSTRSGPVCKFLRKSLSIDVICIEHVDEYIKDAA